MSLPGDRLIEHNGILYTRRNGYMVEYGRVPRKRQGNMRGSASCRSCQGTEREARNTGIVIGAIGALLLSKLL